jgi:hypothetical protein
VLRGDVRGIPLLPTSIYIRHWECLTMGANAAVWQHVARRGQALGNVSQGSRSDSQRPSTSSKRTTLTAVSSMHASSTSLHPPVQVRSLGCGVKTPYNTVAAAGCCYSRAVECSPQANVIDALGALMPIIKSFNVGCALMRKLCWKIFACKGTPKR